MQMLLFGKKHSDNPQRWYLTLLNPDRFKGGMFHANEYLKVPIKVKKGLDRFAVTTCAVNLFSSVTNFH